MNDEVSAVIAEVLGVPRNAINENTSTQTEPKWDSLRHMNLIFALEDHFGVRFCDDEIPALTSIVAIDNAIASRRRT